MSGHGLDSALTGGYHLAYLVGALLVAAGIAAALLVLRPPASRVQREIEELERSFERAGTEAQVAEQLA